MIKIRDIRAKHLGKEIEVRGRIEHISAVLPTVESATFECPSCGKNLIVKQIDRVFREPTRCPCNWQGAFKLLSKDFNDVMRIVLQQLKEDLDKGEDELSENDENLLSREIKVFLKGDLCDPKNLMIVKPKKTVVVKGHLEEVPVFYDDGNISTRFDIAIDASKIKEY
ncbi:MAG: hypothetical protein Q7S74_03650 [Nanoarchaeota archaeon]|nr:hypothetical protein [Nanoarchaeota archaeon]